MSASVGKVHSIYSDGRVGPGFVLRVNQKPIVGFIFDREVDAQLAAKQMSEAVAGATAVAVQNGPSAPE